MTIWLWPGLRLYGCTTNEELIAAFLAMLEDEPIIEQLIGRDIERIFAEHIEGAKKGTTFLRAKKGASGKESCWQIELAITQKNPQAELDEWLICVGHEIAHTFFFTKNKQGELAPRTIVTEEEEKFCDEFAAAWLARNTNRAELRELLLETVMRGKELWFELDEH